MPGINVRFRAFTNKPVYWNRAKLMLGAVTLEKAWAQRIISLLKKYPPMRSGQTYVRTNVLGASWGIEGPTITATGIITRIVNYAVDKRGRRYAQYVQGTWQVPIHEGRWLRADDPDVLQRSAFRTELRRLVTSALHSP